MPVLLILFAALLSASGLGLATRTPLPSQAPHTLTGSETLSGWADQTHPPPRQAAIRVVDDTGRTVQLAAPARRIVTLSPHATELVFAAGAGDRLVAVAPYSDFPPAAARLPTLGGLGGLDRERLLALAPDLVIAWDSGNRPTDLAWLDQQHIAVYRSEPRALQDIALSLVDIGRLAGTVGIAGQAAADYLEALERACPQAPRKGRTAFLLLAERPLLTVGHGHWMDQAIRRVGMRNVYDDLPGRALTVSEESLMARRPSVVLHLAYPGTSLPGIGLDPALWARPGPRLPAGITRLCEALADERAADSDQPSRR